MIRRDRHASAVELASLAVGELRVRKATRIETHLARCEDCTLTRRQLDGMPAVLAGASFPSIPERVTIRIEATLAVEARQRIADLPATEAGRGDLPAGHRRRAAWSGWQLPRLSVTATRLVAGTAVLAIVAAGTYELSQHTGGATTSSAAGSAAAPAPVQQMSAGPDVTYGTAGARHTIHVFQSSANFAHGSLGTEAVDAVHAAEARSVAAQPPSVKAPSNVPNASAAGSAAGGTPSRLAGCVNLIAAARTVLLVDIARFEHKPATIIVLAATAAGPAEAWVVGSTCSASARDVLAHAILRNL
ncbi:MAG TPA: hypothetical protein VEV45_26205 [Streptosporangiaceae bacterium]|nr:hypothetical protein [Streptosporangiaceae bacterium]